MGDKKKVKSLKFCFSVLIFLTLGHILFIAIIMTRLIVKLTIIHVLIWTYYLVLLYRHYVSLLQLYIEITCVVLQLPLSLQRHADKVNRQL